MSAQGLTCNGSYFTTFAAGHLLTIECVYYTLVIMPSQTVYKGKEQRGHEHNYISYIYVHYIIIYTYIYIYIYIYGARARAGGTCLVAVLHAASVIGCWGRVAGAASVIVCW